MTKTRNGISSRLQTYFKEYEACHRSQENKLCHYFGIPIITVTLLGLLSNIQIYPPQSDSSDIFRFVRMDGGSTLWFLAMIWYLRLDRKAATLFGVTGVGCYFIGRLLPLPALWSLFVLGWIVQFVGHYYFEKKPPAFFSNVLHILIGPLWLFCRTTGLYH